MHFYLKNDHHLSDNQLKSILYTSLCASLELRVHRTNLSPSLSLSEWIDEVDKLDEERLAKTDKLDAILE